MKKLIITIALILFCSNANASKSYEIEDHIEANFKTMVWYDGGYFLNKEYTEDDIWNIAHQLVDINFYIFQEEIEGKIASGEFSVEGKTPKQLLRLTLAQYIYDNHKQWIKEAFNTAEKMIEMESEETGAVN